MSIITSKSRLDKISLELEGRYDANERIRNRIRFDIFKEYKIRKILRDVAQNKYDGYEELCSLLTKTELLDTDVLDIFEQACECLPNFNFKYEKLVTTLINIDCMDRDDVIKDLYERFITSLLIAHNRYTELAIKKIISCLIPKSLDEDEWPNGYPTEKAKKRNEYIIGMLFRVMEVIPMVFEIILEEVAKQFPYLKDQPFVVAGYINNLTDMIDKKPIFQTSFLKLIMEKLLVLDVNSPKHEIEEAELENEEECEDKLTEKSKNVMLHDVAETYDLCFYNFLNYIDMKFKENDKVAEKMYNILTMIFDSVIIPTHKPHHLQFIIFYICSLKLNYSELYLKYLWHKVCNPNIISEIRQTYVSYISSFLARSKFLPLGIVKAMLKELCTWAHNYIENCDSMKYNNSIRAHSVFYSVCQGIFYVIAFRSKQLTDGSKNLMYLQSLQLSSLVTCHLNPLRVCLPAIVQTFAGVTRAYQLAYCHTVIEKNIRSKIATVYLNPKESPDDEIDQFFPFDPCLLKRTEKKINHLYLQYQNFSADYESGMPPVMSLSKRQRLESEMSEIDDNDDFLLDANKKLKLDDFNKNLSYIYPGFNK